MDTLSYVLIAVASLAYYKTALVVIAALYERRLFLDHLIFMREENLTGSDNLIVPDHFYTVMRNMANTYYSSCIKYELLLSLWYIGPRLFSEGSTFLLPYRKEMIHSLYSEQFILFTAEAIDKIKEAGIAAEYRT